MPPEKVRFSVPVIILFLLLWHTTELQSSLHSSEVELRRVNISKDAIENTVRNLEHTLKISEEKNRAVSEQVRSWGCIL